MFFTQDDYKKIQQWLTKHSVKDTEFNEANIPFNGEETITIVQGNQNKKVFLKDLIAQVFNLGISDFVNITDKYDAPNISLEEAIRLIPSRARKEGQVITFLDREDHWHIYQFKGVLNQWNVLDTWEDLFDWEKLIIDSILPDEEDLTKSPADENGNSYLSLKDRAYNPEDFSGLGRVILRKNIVEIEDPVYGKVKKNILYQDMFTQSNTIYEIRYDFDLNGAEIIIPEGCVLDFQGGSFNNGTVKGKLLNNYIKPEWFGAKGDGITDDLESFKIAISLHRKLKLSNKTYFISKAIELPGGATIEGAMKGKEYNTNDNDSNTVIRTTNGAFILADSYTEISNIYFSSESTEDSCIVISTSSKWTVEHRLANLKIVRYNIGIEFTSTMGSAINTFDNIYFNSCKVGVKNVNQVVGDIAYSNRFTSCAFWFCDNPLYIGNGTYNFTSCSFYITKTNSFSFVPLCVATFYNSTIECGAIEQDGVLFTFVDAVVDFISCHFTGNKKEGTNLSWFYLNNKNTDVHLLNSFITYYNIDKIFSLLPNNQIFTKASAIRINNTLYRRSSKSTYILDIVPVNLLSMISIDNIIYIKQSSTYYNTIYTYLKDNVQLLGLLDDDFNVLSYAIYNGNHIVPLDQIDSSIKIVYFDNYWKTASIYDWVTLKDSKTAEAILIKEGNIKLAIAINSSTSLYKWANDWKLSNGFISNKSIIATNDYNGLFNTNKIIETNGESAPAADYCHSYSTSNLNVGLWSLPSLGEMLLILKYKNTINSVFGVIGASSLITDDLYWTSTESSDVKAWAVRANDSYTEKEGFDKKTMFKVLPIISITNAIENNEEGNRIGQSKFNTILNKPIWWTGSKWVDATGADV